jgi:diguanylate cyclase (GGDEF)-like protein
MERNDPAYLRKNLYPSLLTDLDISAFILEDTHGRVVLSGRFNTARKEIEPLPGEDRARLVSQGVPSGPPRSGQPGVCVVDLPGGPVMVASHEILRSDGTGPSRGKLILTRLIDPSRISPPGRPGDVPISIHRISDPAIPPEVRSDFSSAPSSPSVDVRSSGWDTLTAYRALRNSRDLPVLAVRVVQQRIAAKTLRGILLSHFFWGAGIVLILLPLFIRLFDRLGWPRVNARRETEQEDTGLDAESLARSTLELLPEHIAILDENGVIIAVNRHWSDSSRTNPLIGKRAVEGSNYLALCEQAEKDNAEYTQAFAAGMRSILSGGSDLFTMEFPCNSGELQFWYQGRVSRFAVGGRARLVVVLRNITDLKEAERDIQKLAYYDPLTGLPNRFLMHDRLGQSLARAVRTKNLVAVLLLDLDYFKLINESLGHPTGDRLLAAVASRLSDNVRKCDTLARMGGDEFVIILNDVKTEEDIVRITKKILDSLSSPFDVGTREVFVGASVGIALHPMDAKEKDKLLKNAETAMYQAKKRGGGTYQFYSAELNLNAEERLSMETNLRYALEREELLLYYQPWIDLQTGEMTGMEALLRWRHPVWGLVPPDKFIPVAEETGLLIPLGEWVLRTACSQTKKLQQDGFSSMRVAVNLSGRQMKHYRLLDSIKEILNSTGLNPACLELEITESCIIDDVKDNVLLLQAIKQLGVSISIDDFGTGYSSLNYLKCFPIDKIKIDQSFMRGIPENTVDSALIQAIIAMARSLNLKVIAEGVEAESQLEFLRRNHCDEVQGYLISPPLSLGDLKSTLSSRTAPGWNPATTSAAENDAALFQTP